MRVVSHREVPRAVLHSGAKSTLIIDMTTANTPPSVWDGQPLHFACLALLLALVWVAWTVTFFLLFGGRFITLTALARERPR